MKFQLEDINIEVISLAGFYTCVQFPTFKTAIDMGICPRSAINKNNVFFTHAHGDHIAGIVRHCSSREMLGLPPPTYTIGNEDLSNLENFLSAARALGRSNMPCTVQGMSPGDHVDIRRNLRVRSYRSVHRVPTQGYVLSEIKEKLKEEYHQRSRAELINIRESGQSLTIEVETPLVSYTGDSTIDVFHQNPQLKDLRILITELTFIGDKIDRAQAKQRGHIHLDDIVHNLEYFQQPAVVLLHFSSRFSTKQVEQACQQKLPNDLFQRLHIVPNDAPLEHF